MSDLRKAMESRDSDDDGELLPKTRSKLDPKNPTVSAVASATNRTANNKGSAASTSKKLGGGLGSGATTSTVMSLAASSLPSGATAKAPNEGAMKTKERGEEEEKAKAKKDTDTVGSTPSPLPDMLECCNGMTSIVGIQHYRGIISKTEQMMTVREPNNPYDKNALAVHNSADVMVGHVPREVARILSPLIDKGQVEIEAYTTKSVGQTYKVPLQLVIFAAAKHHQSLQNYFARSSVLSGFSTEPAVLAGGRRGEQELFEEAMDGAFTALDSIHGGISPALPTAVFKGTLLPFQSQALGWMLEREKLCKIKFPDADSGDSSLKRKRSSKKLTIEEVAANEKVGTYFWASSIDKKTGKKVFTCTLTNFQTTEHPTRPRGGILADDMGLGKTVQMLSLLSHPVDQGGTAAATTAGKVVPTTAKTLIVTPLSLSNHWTDHIKKFLPSYDVCLFNSAGDRDSASVDKAQIVICTYGVLRSEHSKKGSSPLFGKRKQKWSRVILDEAHYISSDSTKTSEACHALEAEVKWCVTGTPLQNRLNDLYSLLKFLKFSPFDQKPWWNSLILKKIRQMDPCGPIRLRSVVTAVCLRRTKESIFDGKPILQLPPINFQLHKIPFSSAEKKVYQELKNRSAADLEKLVKSDSKQGTAVAALVLLLRLRQLCNDQRLVPATVLQGGDGGSGITDESELKILADILMTASDETCSICFDDISNAIVTTCRHLFCQSCIEELLNHHSENPSACRCPNCRHAPVKIALTETDVKVKEDQEEEMGGKKGNSITDAEVGSKVKFACDLIRQHREKDKSTKVVVFSQWPSTLKLIQEHLDNTCEKNKEPKIRVASLTGAMDAKLRQKNVDSFTSSGRDSAEVMLLSKLAGGTGLNLVCASVCILVDPWWNPSTDRQAIMRVHRIGQQRDVTVHQLVIEGSVEEGILDLQRKKKLLIQTALGGGDSEDSGKGKNGKDGSSRHRKKTTNIANVNSLDLAEIKALLR